MSKYTVLRIEEKQKLAFVCDCANYNNALDAARNLRKSAVQNGNPNEYIVVHPSVKGSKNFRNNRVKHVVELHNRLYKKYGDKA